MAAFLNTGFTAAFTPYWIALESDDLADAERNLLHRIGREGAADRHEKLEAMLSSRDGPSPYLMGERPTLADAVFVGVARRASFHDAIDPSVYPRIAALRERLQADPAVRFAQAIERGEQASGSGALGAQLSLADALAAARTDAR